MTDRHCRRARRVRTAGFPRVTVPGSPPRPSRPVSQPHPRARRAPGPAREWGFLREAAQAWDQMESPERPSQAG